MAESERVQLIDSALDALSRRIAAEPRLAHVAVRFGGGRLLELSHGGSLVFAMSAGHVGPDDEAWRAIARRARSATVGWLVVALPEDPPADAATRVPGNVAAASVVAFAGAPWAVLDVSARDDVLFSTLDGLFERVALRVERDETTRALARTRGENDELLAIARAITHERDIDRLLALILEKSRAITGADAGSIYTVDDDAAQRGGADDPKAEPDAAPRERQLRFHLSQNDSIHFASRAFTVPISRRSIAGYAVLERRPVRLDDVYDLPDDAPFSFDRTFDARVGYRTRSMIAVPMITAENAVIGVIQLINRKRDANRRLADYSDFDAEVIPFDERSENVLVSLASQAGIALENALLYDEIRRIFDGFVRASVQAIEQRDPTTSGHSLRVSRLCLGLADVVSRESHGPFADMTFTARELKELEYAALLHDFGKIGVREQVLVKSKKLHAHELVAFRDRVRRAEQQLEIERLELELARARGQLSDQTFEASRSALVERAARLAHAVELVVAANEPTVLREGDFGRIAEVGAIEVPAMPGATAPLLSEVEIQALQVTRGSLSPSEIDEIRAHVTHTIDFLSRIPWGASFSRVPVIAGAHHERLNGTGYPRGLAADEIPLASKIMTVADIFDALTARDRPYKRAVPVDRALDILDAEVRDGHVDAELVRLFRDAKVYGVVEG